MNLFIRSVGLCLIALAGGIAFGSQGPEANVQWHFVDQATVPELGPDTPEYARLLYGNRVDMRQLQDALDQHYAGREDGAWREDLERDPYAKYVHTWIRSAQHFIDDDGMVFALDTEQLVAMRLREAERGASAGTLGAESAATWSFVGPRRTLWRADHVESQPVAPWQVNIYCIASAPSDPDILLCGSETGAVYRSTDRGLNWQACDSFNWGRAILSVAIHPTDPDVLFAGTATDVVRSTDGGESWGIVLTESGLSCNALAISPTDPLHIYAGGAAGLFASADGGDSWSQVLGTHVDDVEFRPGDGATVYAVARNGSPDTYSLYRSTDGGQTFSLAMAGWPSLLESSGARLAVTPADADVVYALLLTEDAPGEERRPVLLRSGDAASTWATVSTCNTSSCPLTNGQGYYDMDVVASASDPDTIMIATTSCYRSTDGGGSWSIVGGYGGPFAIHPDIQAMITAPDGTEESTWIATDGGLSYSSDFFGDTNNWEARIDGLDGTDFWGFAQGWNEDFQVGGRYHNGNTALHENYPGGHALRLGGAESPTGWVLHGRERHAAFDDIEELILPAAIDEAPAGSFPFTKHPSIHYYGDAFSRVMVDPEDFMHVYVGSGPEFWSSTDGGASWKVNATIGGTVFHYDISRADPNVFYLTSTNGFYRSSDRGKSFLARTLPAGFTSYHSQNLRVAADSSDPDRVWILNQRSSAASTAARVLVSADGGGTWTDLTTPALLGRKWTSISHQVGTNGGVYIASRRGEAGGMPAKVMYRDSSMSDWMDYSAGLPPSANPIKLVPYYRGGKLRWAGNRGVWEIDLIEPLETPIAQPFVSGKSQICLRDPVELDSYSIALASATYQWSIPGASTTTALDERQVLATFPAVGTYTAELTVTQGGSSDAASVTFYVGNECAIEPDPGLALSLDGATQSFAVSRRPLDIETNELTFSAWIRRDGDQVPFSGLVFERHGSSAGLNMQYDNRLGFHWHNSQWGWNSGLVVPDGEWAHVAMVVTPTDTTLYLNGQGAINGADPAPYLFDGSLHLGADPPWSSRRFRGQMDEVRVYGRALSAQEIRESMHVIPVAGSDPSLLAYWQCNRPDGPMTDRVGTNHMWAAGNATRIPSSAPVGSGTSASRSVLTAGIYAFPGTGLELDFTTGALPAGDLVVTRLERAPHGLPPSADAAAYWLIHSFGNPSFGVPRSLQFQGLAVTASQALVPAGIHLYRRPVAGEGLTWGVPQDSADDAASGSSGSVFFSQGNGLKQSSQLLVTFPGLAARGAK